VCVCVVPQSTNTEQTQTRKEAVSKLGVAGRKPNPIYRELQGFVDLSLTSTHQSPHSQSGSCCMQLKVDTAVCKHDKCSKSDKKKKK